LSIKLGVCHITGCKGLGLQRLRLPLIGVPRISWSFSCQSGWQASLWSPALWTPAVVMAAREKTRPQYHSALVLHGLSVTLYHENALDITPASSTAYVRMFSVSHYHHSEITKPLTVRLIRSTSASLWSLQVSINLFLCASSASLRIKFKVLFDHRVSITSAIIDCE
jgi:hypothetical protein